MKQSEYKKQLEESYKGIKEQFEAWQKRSIRVDEIVCKNKNFKNHLGGYDEKGRQQRCWDCPNCGKVGCDYIPSSLLGADKINYINCDLEEG